MALYLPDELIPTLQSLDMPRRLLEAFAVEGYREDTLTIIKQVRLLLGFETRFETEDFLGAHGVWPGLTVEELAAGADALRSLRQP